MLTETTTAWGAGLPLDAALDRLFTERPDTKCVELSVGTRPGDPSLLDRYPDVKFIGHHVFPLGQRNLRPNSRDKDELIDMLVATGIKRYTAHPPHKKFTRGLAGLHEWCRSWHDSLAEHGIEFAVETMYTPRDRKEREVSGGYFLSTPTEVWEFVEWADWDDPLVLDASHLYIGWSGGVWTDQDIYDLLMYAPAKEIHISENDGRRDLHRPLSERHKVSEWVDGLLGRFEYTVLEGKYRLENNDNRVCT